ncbi:MAG: Flp pilus assembly protein CpaB [Myxococcales bacterium]|nr:Flp pilus assembly protein CpaB [Myxococcales bacterium]
MTQRILAFSMLSALIGGALLHRHMRDFERRMAGGQTTEVLVLRDDGERGEPLSRERLSVRPLPEAYLESRHIPAGRLEEILDSSLGVDVRAGEALLWTDLEGMRERSERLSELVPPGMRGYSLAPGGFRFGGLLQLGDRVDVLGETEGQTRTVAQNLLVLSLGASASRPARSPDGQRRPVTLSVSPEQGRLLAAAEARGALRLTLRNPDDVSLDQGVGGGAALLTGAEHKP